MASLSLRSAAETAGANAPTQAAPEAPGELLLIAGFGDPVAADFAAFAERRGVRAVVVPAGHDSRSALSGAQQGRRVSGAVIFLGRGPAAQHAALDEVMAAVAEGKVGRVCLVSTLGVHFRDRGGAAAETRVLDRLKAAGVRPVLVRAGHVLSPGSRASVALRALWFCYPLVPQRFRNCFVAGDELFAALLLELTGPATRNGATYTLLGRNRAWRDVLREHADRSPVRRGLAAAAAALSWVGVGLLAGLLFSACARPLRRLRRWDFDTLSPSSVAELLALHNKYNYPHVKIVGYNNGAVHFGQKHPGRTVITTARCNARRPRPGTGRRVRRGRNRPPGDRGAGRRRQGAMRSA